MSRICKYFASGYCKHGNMCRYRHSSSGHNPNDYRQQYEYEENNYHNYEYDYAPISSYHGRSDKHRGQKESFNHTHHRTSSFDQFIEDVKESALLYEYLKWDLTAMDMGTYLPVGLVEISPEEVRHYTHAIKELGHRLKPFNKLIKKTVTQQQLIYRHLTKMEPATRNTLKKLYKLQMDKRDIVDNVNDSENLLVEIAEMVTPFPRYRKPSPSTVTKDVMDVSRAKPEQIMSAGPKPTEISFNFAHANATNPHLASTPRVKPVPTNELPIPEPKVPHDLASPRDLLVEIAEMVIPFPRYLKPSPSTVTEDVMDVSRAKPEQIRSAGPKPTEISFNFARANATNPHLASTPRVKPVPTNELAIPESKVPHDAASPRAQVLPLAADDPLLPDQIYTPLDTLTDEEKQAFMEAVFVVGKVPTLPPPLELCYPKQA